MTRPWAATGDAVARLDENGGGWSVALTLDGSGAQCLAVDPADPDRVFAGLHDGGVRRTEDAGQSWQDCDLPEPAVFSLAVSRVDGAVYAGTEPSRVFRSDGGGEGWEELETLQDLPSRPTWSFPPRPWTSHVRWIAPSPHDAGLLLAGIELGGLMRSTDRGASWEDHRAGAQRDVHSLAWHPSVEGRAYEAGGGGAAYSTDAGATWQPADEGRDRHYTWSVAVDPVDADCWFISASTGPFRAHRDGDPQAGIFRRVAEGALAAARRRAARPAAVDALRTRSRGRPAVRRPPRRRHLGNTQPRRELAPGPARPTGRPPRRAGRDLTRDPLFPSAIRESISGP